MNKDREARNLDPLIELPDELKSKKIKGKEKMTAKEKKQQDLMLLGLSPIHSYMLK